MRPVVVAGFERGPGFFEALLPAAVLEEPPEGRRRDLDAVVEVRFPEAGDAQQFVAEGGQFEGKIAQPFQFFLF